MKKTPKKSPIEKAVPAPANSDELRPEYRFDYAKARPNRFAGRVEKDVRVIVLDPDVARVFTSPESVNQVLRALIQAMPQSPQR